MSFKDDNANRLRFIERCEKEVVGAAVQLEGMLESVARCSEQVDKLSQDLQAHMGFLAAWDAFLHPRAAAAQGAEEEEREEAGEPATG